MGTPYWRVTEVRRAAVSTSPDSRVPSLRRMGARRAAYLHPSQPVLSALPTPMLRSESLSKDARMRRQRRTPARTSAPASGTRSPRSRSPRVYEGCWCGRRGGSRTTPTRRALVRADGPRLSGLRRVAGLPGGLPCLSLLWLQQVRLTIFKSLTSWHIYVMLPT